MPCQGGGRTLEAGCGQGRWVIYLNERGYRTVGLEIYEEALKPAKRRDPKTPLTVGNVLQLPYQGDRFDLVISLGVVEHFDRGPEGALQEMHRVLKPEGILFLTVPFESFLRRWVHRPYHHAVTFLKRRRGKSFTFGEYRYNRTEMERFLKGSGFRILTCLPDDFRPPKSLGFYTDWMRYVGKKGRKWELNGPGTLLNRALQALPGWTYPSGILFIAQKHGVPTTP